MAGARPDENSEQTAFYARSADEWRAWLAENGEAENSVNLVFYHKGAGVACVAYEEAVGQALCFGWIDGKASKRDERSYIIRFTPRSLKSTWSNSNRERVERLTAEGRMTPAGQAVIERAKADGAWDRLAAAQNGEIPPDLLAEFTRDEAAFRNFQSFSKAIRRACLEWVLDARRPETRRKRISRLVELAARNRSPFTPQSPARLL